MSCHVGFSVTATSTTAAAPAALAFRTRIVRIGIDVVVARISDLLIFFFTLVAVTFLSGFGLWPFGCRVT